MANKTKIIILSSIIFLAIVVSALFIINSIYWARAGQDVQFAVEPGMGTRKIAEELKSQKLIQSPLVFSAFVYSQHRLLQSGVYEIKATMSLSDIVQMFEDGDVQQYLITIPEGWRVAQIDKLLSDKKIIDRGDFLKIASGEEGYLFPDTYSFPIDVTVEQIKNLLMDNFKKKTTSLNISSAKLNEIIILASIVEREAKLDSDRAKIAGVYKNRLDVGMRLEADPTIQYGKGDWDPITRDDYKNFQSPYNTYLHTGLPPGPICNPGLESINAALNPEVHGYFYFFHKADGTAVFSKTFDEHKEKLKSP